MVHLYCFFFFRWFFHRAKLNNFAKHNQFCTERIKQEKMQSVERYNEITILAGKGLSYFIPGTASNALDLLSKN
jgi:hypothetical protein